MLLLFTVSFVFLPENIRNYISVRNRAEELTLSRYKLQRRKPMTTMEISKAEVNLSRLLSRCEGHVTSLRGDSPAVDEAKLHSYVVYAQELLAALEGEGPDLSPPSISQEKASEYKDRISKILESLGPPPRPIDVWDSQPQGEKLKEPPLREPELTVNLSPPEPSLASILRRRARLQNGASEGTSSDAEQTKIDDASRLIIEKNKVLQEDLTDQMLELAGHLKVNSRLINATVQESNKILDNAEVALERNVASTGNAVRRTTVASRRSFFTGCMTWLLIFVLFWLFIGMIVVIRIT